MDIERKKLSIITLGCQMNKHDSQWVAGLMADEYELTDNNNEADLLVVNTCAVREKAEQKFFSLLGRLRPLKQIKPKLVVAVAGCIAQEQAETIIRREPLVDIVFGTRAIEKLPALLDRFYETGRPQIDISDEAAFDNFPMIRDSKESAWVSVMRGCDNHCSYCIVPAVRGTEQSRPAESIIREIAKLVVDGCKEVTLLGQNVNSYGADRRDKDVLNFPDLLRAIDRQTGIRRIRFVTSHPKDLSDDLIDVMASLDSVCPSLHLPLQSGSDRILRLMNRGYSRERYFDRVERLRQSVPDICLTADIIVGFPGETDDDFADTMSAVERARYDNFFLFKYSPRPGTEAALLSDTIAPDVAQRRFEQVYVLQKKITRTERGKLVGREVEVMVEAQMQDEPGRYRGRSPQNHTIFFSADSDMIGAFVHVKIVPSSRNRLEGILLAATQPI